MGRSSSESPGERQKKKKKKHKRDKRDKRDRDRDRDRNRDRDRDKDGSRSKTHEQSGEPEKPGQDGGDRDSGKDRPRPNTPQKQQLVPGEPAHVQEEVEHVQPGQEGGLLGKKNRKEGERDSDKDRSRSNTPEKQQLAPGGEVEHGGSGQEGSVPSGMINLDLGDRHLCVIGTERVTGVLGEREYPLNLEIKKNGFLDHIERLELLQQLEFGIAEPAQNMVDSVGGHVFKRNPNATVGMAAFLDQQNGLFAGHTTTVIDQENCRITIDWAERHGGGRLLEIFVAPDGTIVAVQFDEAQLDGRAFLMARTTKATSPYPTGGMWGDGLKQTTALYCRRGWSIQICGTLEAHAQPAWMYTNITGNGGVASICGKPLRTREDMLPENVLQHCSETLRAELRGDGQLLCHVLSFGDFTRAQIFAAVQFSHVLFRAQQLSDHVSLAPGFNGVPSASTEDTQMELAFLDFPDRKGGGYTNGELSTRRGTLLAVGPTDEMKEISDPRRHDNFLALDTVSQTTLEFIATLVHEAVIRGRNEPWLNKVREFARVSSSLIDRINPDAILVFKELVTAHPPLQKELEDYLALKKCELCAPDLKEALPLGLHWAALEETGGLVDGMIIDPYPAFNNLPCTEPNCSRYDGAEGLPRNMITAFIDLLSSTPVQMRPTARQCSWLAPLGRSMRLKRRWQSRRQQVHRPVRRPRVLHLPHPVRRPRMLHLHRRVHRRPVLPAHRPRLLLLPRLLHLHRPVCRPRVLQLVQSRRQQMNQCV
jgi:hypothetical protein